MTGWMPSTSLVRDDRPRRQVGGALGVGLTWSLESESGSLGTLDVPAGGAAAQYDCAWHSRADEPSVLGHPRLILYLCVRNLSANFS